MSHTHQRRWMQARDRLIAANLPIDADGKIAAGVLFDKLKDPQFKADFELYMRNDDRRSYHLKLFDEVSKYLYKTQSMYDIIDPEQFSLASHLSNLAIDALRKNELGRLFNVKKRTMELYSLVCNKEKHEAVH